MSSGASSTIDLEPVEDENGTGVKITVTNTAADGAVSREMHTVYDGKDGAGDGESEIFHVTIDVTTETASHSPAELCAAVENGKTVLLRCSMDGTQMSLPMLYTSETIAQFCTAGYGGYNLGIKTNAYNVFIYEDKSIAFEFGMTSMCVPSVTTDDIGKVLACTNTGLAWVEQSGGSAVPSVEGVEF